jgi:glycosyltransferase involved in cell wall biosynthesis
MRPVVSVVVPTYRRAALLDRCLAALTTQDYPADRYEIIVVDDAASPETARQVACQAERTAVTLRYLTPPGPVRRGPAAARNHGWHNATGAIIAFTDDDCIPDPGWLAAGVAAFDSSDGNDAPLAGGWGRTRVPLPPTPTDYELDAAGLERAEAISANAFYRREILAAVGGFDERFRAAWREDSDLLFTLLERGARVEPIPAAIVVHPVRPACWGVSLGQQRKSRYNALLYKKHPRLYRERIQGSPPWGYYATVATALLAALGLARGRRGLALSAAVGWLGLTGRFCGRRLKDARRTPNHLAEMAVTSALIPPLSIYWRLRGAWENRVFFL